MEAKFIEYEQEYQKIKNTSQEEVTNRNKEITYAERKTHLSFLKKKMEVHSTNLQYNHSKLLKELELKKANGAELALKENDLN